MNELQFGSTGHWRFVGICILCGAACYEYVKNGIPTGEYRWRDDPWNCAHELNGREFC